MGSGGGISNDGGTLTITHSLVTQNAATVPDGGPPELRGRHRELRRQHRRRRHADHRQLDDRRQLRGRARRRGQWSRCATQCSSTAANNTTTITNSTIADNNGGSAGVTGGGAAGHQGTISIGNSIVASNIVTNANGAQTASNCGAGAAGVPNPSTQLARLQHRDRDRLRLQVDGGPAEHRPAIPDRRPRVQRGQHRDVCVEGRRVRRSTRSQPRSPAARAPTSATSPVRRARAATSAHSSCSSPSRACRPPGSSARSEPTHRRRSTGATAHPPQASVNSLGQVTATHTYAEEGVYHGGHQLQEQRRRQPARPRSTSRSPTRR